MTVTGDLEEHFRNQIQQVDGDFHLGVSPQVAEGLLNQLEQSMAQMSAMGHMPVLGRTRVTPTVRNLIGRFLPQLIVISHKEVAQGISVSADGEVGYDLVRLVANTAPSMTADAGNLSPSMV